MEAQKDRKPDLSKLEGARSWVIIAINPKEEKASNEISVNHGLDASLILDILKEQYAALLSASLEAVLKAMREEHPPSPQGELSFKRVPTGGNMSEEGLGASSKPRSECYQ